MNANRNTHLIHANRNTHLIHARQQLCDYAALHVLGGAFALRSDGINLKIAIITMSTYNKASD